VRFIIFGLFLKNMVELLRKSLVIILFSTPSLGFSQTVVNNDSLLYHFKNILNNYRKSYGILPLEVDSVLKTFTVNWSKHMSLTGIVGHGSGENSFQKRIETCGCFPPATFCLENCTEIYTPDVNTKDPVSCPIKNIEPYIKKAYSGKITQYELAYFAFLNFKNSSPHNAAMLSKDTKYFHIYGSRNNGTTFISYVARQ
jgi:uncharacterized protein YkwD